MTEHARPSYAVRSVRIGRTDLGAGTVAVDEDSLMIELAASLDDRPFRVPLSSLDGVAVRAGELQLLVTDGTQLTLLAERTGADVELRDEIVASCHAIPELTRALRAFGSRRGHGSARASGPAEQRRFFAPLLDARRVAVMAAAPTAALGAFDAATLAQAIDATMSAFALERHGDNAPARRALEAELVDLTEPLRDELATLGQVAVDANGAADDLRLWRAWSQQLRRTFETADRVWLLVDSALDSDPWRR